jgi:hypothetical protein
VKANVEIVEGLLVTKYPRSIPACFWDRLQHLVDRAGMADEFKASRLASKDGPGDPWDREDRLFRHWVQRLGLEVPLWPWDRGWTQAQADSYLDPNAHQAGTEAA